MELQEFKNVESINGDPPQNFGWTILVQPRHGDSPHEFLVKVKDIWTAVAQWGTWRDEEMGEWPSDEACLASLPEWFRTEIKLHQRLARVRGSVTYMIEIGYGGLAASWTG